MDFSHNVCVTCSITASVILRTNGPLIRRFLYIIFQSHVREMLKAVNEDGCNVKAYTFWSLLDSFEWNFGYT